MRTSTPIWLLCLSLVLPRCLSLRCVRLQPTGGADALAAAAAALGAAPVLHADGSLELLGDGELERVLASLEQAEGRPLAVEVWQATPAQARASGEPRHFSPRRVRLSHQDYLHQESLHHRRRRLPSRRCRRRRHRRLRHHPRSSPIGSASATRP